MTAARDFSGRRAGRLVLMAAALGLAFVCLVEAQSRLDDMRKPQDYDETLLYLPNENLLNYFTAGLSSVIADVLWVKCVQYTSIHFKTDRKFTWLNHMCTMITRLDPYFADVYRYGAIFLAGLKADDDASILLLHRGMVENPDAWLLPYEAAAVYLLNRRDWPGARDTAAAYLGMAVATGHAPPMVVDLAEGIMARQNLLDVERDMWQRTLEGNDPFLRQVAERKLQELSIRQSCQELNRAADAHRQRHGTPPKDLRDLVPETMLPLLQKDACGGHYFLDQDGAVQNTTLLDDQVNRGLTSLRRSLDTFRERQRRWPKTLQEIVDTGMVSQLPEHPYEGRQWRYDPATGEVQ